MNWNEAICTLESIPEFHDKRVLFYGRAIIVPHAVPTLPDPVPLSDGRRRGYGANLRRAPAGARVRWRNDARGLGGAGEGRPHRSGGPVRRYRHGRRKGHRAAGGDAAAGTGRRPLAHFASSL